MLARNEGALLPLSTGSLRRVAVLGPNAAVARTLGGGSATVFPTYTVSPLDGLRAALDAEVTHAPGVRVHSRLPVARVSAEVRYLAADGGLVASERRETGDFTWLGTLPEGVAAIEVHTTLRGRGRARRRLLGRRPLPAVAGRSSSRSTSGSSCRPAPTSPRRCCSRPSTACRSCWRAAGRSRRCCATRWRARR